MKTKFIKTDRVVEHEYVNGKRGEALYQQLDKDGRLLKNFWTLNEVKSIGGEIIKRPVTEKTNTDVGD